MDEVSPFDKIKMRYTIRVRRMRNGKTPNPNKIKVEVFNTLTAAHFQRNFFQIIHVAVSNILCYIPNDILVMRVAGNRKNNLPNFFSIVIVRDRNNSIILI